MKSNRKNKWPFYLLLMPLCFWGSSVVLDRWHYATSDEISRSGIDTRRVLRRYESNNDATEIHQWILNGPTEAPGTQMCTTLSEWSTDHRKEFIAIVEGLPSEKQNQFMEKLTVSLNQSSPEMFKLAFKTAHSPSIQKIINQLS